MTEEELEFRRSRAIRRRKPVAVVLHEGGKFHKATTENIGTAPILIFENGSVWDDIVFRHIGDGWRRTANYKGEMPQVIVLAEASELAAA